MTVIAAFTVQFREFAGFQEPGLPIAVWRVQGTVLGDASAGIREIDFRFSLSGQRASQNFFSIEQFGARDNDNNDKIGRCVVLNMDDFEGTAITNTWSFQLRATGTVASAGLNPADANGIRGSFIGRPFPSDITAVIALQLPNVDTGSFIAQMGGYVWSPRAVNVDGGLRRPASGLYR